jgi:hypothetical protein
MLIYFQISKAYPVLILNNNTASVNTSGLFGYWRFENESSGIAVDYSGYGNNGTLTSMNNSGNSTSGPTVNGMFGKAMQFDGVNDYVNIGNSTSFNITGEITVSAWVYPLSAPASEGRTAVSRYRWYSDAEYGWNLGASWTGNAFAFIVYNGSGVYGWAEDSNFFATKLNTWTHFVGVFKPSQYVYLYEDGVLVDSDTSVPINIVYNRSTDNVTIGRRSGDAQSYFNGTIDEVQIWNRSLTAGEISELYKSQVIYGTSTTFTGSNCNGLCSLYRNETLTVTNTENGTATVLPAGWNYYIYNTSGNQNYTQSSILLPINVTPSITTCTVFPSTQSITYGSSITQYCGSDYGSCKLYKNSTEITTLNNTAVVYGVGDHAFVGNLS